MVNFMKILHVAHFFYPCLSAGGVVNASYQIASKQSRDNEVKVFSSDSCKERLKFPNGRYDVDVNGIKVDYFKNLSNRFKLATMLDTPLAAPFKIRNDIRNYDIIHIHEHRQTLAIIVSCYASKNNIPYIVQAHGSVLPFFQKESLKNLFDKVFGFRILHNAACVFALTEVEKEQYLKMGVDEDKIEIVPLGINLEEYENLPSFGMFRSKFNIGYDDKLILFVGRLHEIKGLDLLIEAFITLFCGIIFMVLMKNKPKHPPSISQEVKSLPLLKGLKKLKSDKNFILLCISLACVVGYINIVATIFNAYMAMYKISDSNASYISAIANILGIINAIVVGAIIDKYKKYKLLIIICNIISLSCYVVTTILIEIIKTKYLYLIAGFGYTLIIMFAVPIYTSGMDFVCEITFGVGESTSEGIIMISNQVVGILGIYITDLLRSNLKRYKYLTNIFGILLFLVSLIVLYFVNPVLVRNEKDHVNNEFEIKEIDYA